MMVRQATRRAEAVGVEPSALGRKRAVSRPTSGRGAFGVRSVVFAVGGMSSSARRCLAERFRSELVGVRALLKRAAEFLAPAGTGKSGLAASSSSLPAAPCGGGKDGRFLVAGIRSGGAPVEAGSKKLGKKRKAPFLLEREDAPKMAPNGRKRLAARLASLSAAELPAQIGEVLQRKLHGSSGKAEIEVHSVDDVALFELKQQLDKCTEEATNHGHEPTMDASAVIHPSPSPRQRQAADGKIAVEEDEDLDICGGASSIPTTLAPLLPDVDYSELVGATGVKPLSPRQPKYIALAERGDVCGGASTVAPALPSPLPAEYSELVGATGVKLLSPLPRKYVALAERVDYPTATALPFFLPEHSDLADAIGARMLSPLPRKYVALAEHVDVVATTATTLPSLLPEHNELADATGVKMLSPLPHKYVALAEEDDEYVDICGDASPVVLPKNHVEIVSINSSPSSSSSSDSDSYSDGGSSSSTTSDSNSEASAAGSTPASAIPTNACISSAQPPEPAAPEVAQSAEQEEKLPDQRVVGSTPAPAIPTNACVSSSAQPPEPSAPEVSQSAEAEQEEALPDHRAATVMASPKPLTNLIARAQGAVARRRHEEKAQAREKARQELLDMERTAPTMTSNAIHSLDMKLLGLVAVEYMVSTDEEVRRTLYSYDSTALRSASPICLSLLEKLGLFLKADDGSDKEQQQLQQPRFVVGGSDDDVEEGEIR